MNRTSRILGSAGNLLLVCLLASVFLYPSLLMAAEKGTSGQSGKSAISEEGGIAENPAAAAKALKEAEDCMNKHLKGVRGAGGCLVHGASNEQSIQGTNCTSGMTCNSPGSPCGFGGRTCKNYDMGGGNCTCACLSP